MEELKSLCEEIQKCNPDQENEPYYVMRFSRLIVECPVVGMFDHLFDPYEGEHFEFVKKDHVKRRQWLEVVLRPKSKAACDDRDALSVLSSLLFNHVAHSTDNIRFYPKTMQLCIGVNGDAELLGLTLPSPIGPFRIAEHSTLKKGVYTVQLARDAPVGHEVKEVENLEAEIQRLKAQRCNRIIEEHPILWVIERLPNLKNHWPKRVFGPFASRAEAEKNFDANPAASFNCRIAIIETSSLTKKEIWALEL